MKHVEDSTSDDPHKPARIQIAADVHNRGYASGVLDAFSGMLAAIRDGTVDAYVADVLRRYGQQRVNAALVERGLPPVEKEP